MPKGVLFWLFMILWFISALVWSWPGTAQRFPYGGGVSSVLLFILFLIVGWALFGAPIQ